MVTFSDEMAANFEPLYVERFRYLKILSASLQSLLYEKESPVIAERFNSTVSNWLLLLQK